MSMRKSFRPYPRNMNSRYGTEKAGDGLIMKKITGIVVRWSERHGLRGAWPIGFFLLGYLVWFHILEAVPRKHYTVVTMKLDGLIPFCEIFIIPYLSWFAFIAFGILSVYYWDREGYDALQTYLMIGMTVFLIISTVLPNRQPLRLLELPRDNVFSRAVARLWKTDTPTNVWPSIHVFNSTAVEIAFLRSKSPKFRHPAFRAATLVWSVLIILSTVFIKQHSIWDVLTALAMIAACAAAVTWKGYVFRFRKWDAFAARLAERFAKP